jgi:16S rRNA (guanine527-N7)-methyltransferase
MNLEASLARGAETLGLALPARARRKLLDYLDLVGKWNKVYNLTAVREPGRMLTHHVLDCLAVAPHVRGLRVLDVGSGAGLPGIPLALAHPERQFVLLDSSHKKAAFLRQAAIELGLANVDVECARAGEWCPQQPFDFVVSRAFSDLQEFVALAGALRAERGVLAAMKGVYPYEELAQLPPGWRAQDVVALAVPGLAAQRHLVLLAPEAGS